MELIRKNTTIDFIHQRKLAFALSALMVLASIGSLLFQGLNFGIDFSGGTLVQVRFDKAHPVGEIRQALSGLNLGDVVIQEFGVPEEILIRVEKQASSDDAQGALAQKVVESLRPLAGQGGVESRRVEFVGPQVGEELAEKGLMAILYSMIAILAYVAWRFEMRFAYGAVLALIHDVAITIGLFSMLQKEFTLVVVAALLTVIGYSLNDTIVVYDRIREEMKRLKKQSMEAILNEAVAACFWGRGDPRLCLDPPFRRVGGNLLLHICCQPHGIVIGSGREKMNTIDLKQTDEEDYDTRFQVADPEFDAEQERIHQEGLVFLHGALDKGKSWKEAAAALKMVDAAFKSVILDDFLKLPWPSVIFRVERV